MSAGVALDIDDLFTDPQLSFRGAFDFVEHPEMGRFPHTRTAWRSRRGHDGVSGPALRYGDGIDALLGDELGLDAEHIDALVQRGATSRGP